MRILAFETSCGETSVAVVEKGNNVLSNIISTQIDIHKEYGGVVPEIASRHHIENILPVYEEALEKANCKIEDIDYIAVTNKPGLIGSLLVGLMFAKSLSYSKKIPLLPVNHIDGHLFSTFIDHEIKLPAVSLIVSGGHTNIYYIDKMFQVKLLGETLDDAVGEAYDKVARVLGLRYPGGPEIDKLASTGQNDLKIPKANISGYNFSFSGIKTYVTNYINNETMKGNSINKENIAKSFQESIVETLAQKIRKVIENNDVNTIMVAGGVSANKRLREKFQEEFSSDSIEVVFPKYEYCTDNAAMIGCAAYHFLEKNIETRNEISLDATSTKNIKK